MTLIIRRGAWAAGVSHSRLDRFRNLPVRFEELTASRNANVI